MKKIAYTPYGVALALLFVSVMFLANGTLVLAHGDEVHEDVATATLHDAELARMEQVIQLLKEVVLLMQALKIQQGYAPAILNVPIDDHEADEMEEHHAEHGDTEAEPVTTTEDKKLIIEVETHNDKTHVHTRYIDKPEEMYFVDVSIDDEDGLIEAIVARTGLSSEEVKDALVYFR